LASSLGVGSKASNLAVVGELGRYPLYIDIVINMIKYWIRLHEDKTNCMLKAALDENNKMHNNGQHCWVSCIYYILKELDMQSNPIFYHVNNNIYILRISTKFSNHCQI
jgi:hypothetical protein